jgi:hypothetical protein
MSNNSKRPIKNHGTVVYNEKPAHIRWRYIRWRYLRWLTNIEWRRLFKTLVARSSQLLIKRFVFLVSFGLSSKPSLASTETEPNNTKSSVAFGWHTRTAFVGGACVNSTIMSEMRVDGVVPHFQTNSRAWSHLYSEWTTYRRSDCIKIPEANTTSGVDERSSDSCFPSPCSSSLQSSPSRYSWESAVAAERSRTKAVQDNLVNQRKIKEFSVRRGSFNRGTQNP